VPDHAIGVHAARTQWLQEHPERAVAALRAMRDAVRWLYDPANKDEAIALLVREAEVTEPLARQTYEFLVEQLKMWNPNLDLAPGIVQKSIDFMAEVGELDPPLPTPQRYMDQRYVQQINQGG